MNHLNAQKIARRYAKAIYETAQEKNHLAETQADLSALAGLIAAQADIAAFFASPIVTTEDKKAVLEDKIIGSLQSQTSQNLLRVLADNNRLELIRDIHSALNDYSDLQHKVATADVTVPVDVSEKTLEKLKAQLEKCFNLNTVNLNVTTDPEIIAGAIVRIQGKVLDGSYRSKLQQVRQHAT